MKKTEIAKLGREAGLDAPAVAALVQMAPEDEDEARELAELFVADVDHDGIADKILGRGGVL